MDNVFNINAYKESKEIDRFYNVTAAQALLLITQEINSCFHMIVKCGNFKKLTDDCIECIDVDDLMTLCTYMKMHGNSLINFSSDIIRKLKQKDPEGYELIKDIDPDKTNYGKAANEHLNSEMLISKRLAYSKLDFIDAREESELLDPDGSESNYPIRIDQADD